MAVNSVRHGFFAIIKVKMSLQLHPHITLRMLSAHALVYLRISAGSPDPLILSIAINLIFTMLALFYDIFISCLY